MTEKTGRRVCPGWLAPWLRSLPCGMRDVRSLVTPHMLGLLILLLTIVPAYVASRSTPNDAREIDRQAPDDEDAIEEPRSEFLAVAIEAHIREVAVRNHIAPILVAAIVEAESEFNPRAVSRRGARGLMQLMPATAAPTSRPGPSLALAMATGARAGWRERQALERQAAVDVMDLMDRGPRDVTGGEPPLLLKPITDRPAAPAGRIQGP